jgi:hypothetical protein
MKDFNEILDNILKYQSDFFLYFEENDYEFNIEMDYTDEEGRGEIVYKHIPTGRLVFVGKDENDAEVFEVKEVARLAYTDVAVFPDDTIFHIFVESDCCGEINECVDNKRFYVWYIKI